MRQIRGMIDYLRMVKFSHSLFALPFAGIGAVLAFLESNLTSFEILRLSVLIIICMVSARSAAMGFNRYIDCEIDKKNPRTANREIPQGKISRSQAMVFILASSLIFVLASYLVNHLAFLLSFPALFFLFLYSLTKRFTLFCHFFLGFGISLAPLGAWIAVKEEISLLPLVLSFGLFLNITAFDILYALQDEEFDKSAGLHSIPAKLGETFSLWLSRALHLLSLVFFLSAGQIANLGFWYWFSLLIVSLLVIAENWIASQPQNKKSLPNSFYQVHSFISLVLFLGILIDQWGDFVGKLQIGMGG